MSVFDQFSTNIVPTWAAGVYYEGFLLVGVSYYTLVHHLRSFTPVSFETVQDHREPGYAGLKCSRDWVTMDGFYGDTTVKLVERRYSVAVTVFPFQKPCGHYVLTTMADYSPADRSSNPGIYNHAMHTAIDDTFGIQSAGVRNGVSMFQIQLCIFIALWKVDWLNTIDAVDKVVSVTVRSYGSFRRKEANFPA